MKRHELVIGNKYKALKDSGGYLKNDVLIFEEDDGSSCPYFRNTRTDEIDPAFLDRLIPIEHRFKVGDTVKTTPELWTAYENYDTNPVVDFSKAYKIKSIGSYHWNDQEEMVVHFNEENSPTGEDIGWIPEACFIHAEEEVPSKPFETKFNVGDEVVVSNKGAAYTTHIKAAEYGCANYIKRNIPENGGEYTIKKLLIINAEDKGCIITDGNQDWLIGIRGISKPSKPKVLMSDGVEPKPGMWVYCIDDCLGDVDLVTEFKDGDWLLDKTLILAINPDTSFGNKHDAPYMRVPKNFRQATNLEVANWCKKHNLWSNVKDKLDFLVGLRITNKNFFAAVDPGSYLIRSVGSDHFQFGACNFGASPSAHPMHELIFSDDDVTPEPISKPTPEPMFSIGDYVYDYDNVIFDVDHKLEIVDTELQDGEWIYSCYDDTEEEGDWLREEQLKQWKEPKMEPVSSGMPDWVFPGVIFWEKYDHSAIRTVKEVLDGIFKSSIWNGSEERLTHSITWDRHDAMKFEPLPYEEAQKRWIKKYNVKPGDSIKVVRQCETRFGGWTNSWVRDGMIVGTIGKFIGTRGSNGISLPGGYDYPYFCLEKVSEAPKQETAPTNPIAYDSDNGERVPFTVCKEAFRQGLRVQFAEPSSAPFWQEESPKFLSSLLYRIHPDDFIKFDWGELVPEAPKQEGLTSVQMSAYGKGLLEQIQSGPIWTGCTTPSAKLHIYQPKIQDLLTVTPERVKFELKITKDKIINL